MSAPVHNFRADLARSHRDGQAAWLESVYRRFFPSLQAVLVHNADGQAQRQGVDKTVVLKNGKTFWIDEKLRYKDYPDIALEEWSDLKRGIPGWVRKPLLCDYIFYVNIPGGKAYLLPTVQLQEAWRTHGAAWKKIAKRIPARNGAWESVCWGVNPDVLYSAIEQTLRANFGEPGDSPSPDSQHNPAGASLLPCGASRQTEKLNGGDSQ